MSGESKISKPSDYFSRKVTIVSFVMAIFVIYIHANNLKYYGIPVDQHTLVNVTVKLFAEVIGGIAVPFFFMLSGYWLFRFDITDSSATAILFSKIQKKVKTLVVPYLLWNAFGMVFYITVTHVPFLSALMNNGKAIEITIPNIVEGLFLHKYYFTFWYLQDLIILTALSPVLLMVLKNRYVGIALMLVSFLTNAASIDLIIVRTSSLMFFMLGAYISIYAREYFETDKGNVTVYLSGFILAGIVRYYHIPVAEQIAFLASPILFWKGIDLLIPMKKLKEPKGFISQSFFIYASHVIPITIIGHILSKAGRGMAWAACSYLISPWITLGLIYLIAKLLHKLCPNFYRMICGYRG